MSRPTHDPRPVREEFEDALPLLFILASVMSYCVMPIIRSRFGVRAFRNYWMAPVLMFAYAGFAQCPLLVSYIPVWLVFVAYRRVTADRNQHSQSQGRSWVLGWLTDEWTAKRCEAFIMFFGAIFAAMISEPLGVFLLLQIPALVVIQAVKAERLEAMRISIADSEREAEVWAQLQREHYRR